MKKETKIKTYKGFDKNMKCRDFQYEVGKEYETHDAIKCETGFHSCENPIDVFSYYYPGESVYCETEASGKIDQDDFDTKIASTKLKIVANINLHDMINAGVELIKKRVDWNNAKESNTGNRSAVTNTGNMSAATNTGNRSISEVKGKESIAIVTGHKSKAAGALGCWIVLTERDDKGHILLVKSVKVDGKKIKADQFYELVNGKITES